MTPAVPVAQLVASLIVATVLSGAAHAAPKGPRVFHVTGEQAYQLALEAETAGELAEMRKLLEYSAVRGFVPAQEHLGVVLLSGDAIYGPGQPGDRCEALRWFLRASEAGSEIGGFYRQLLLRNRRRNGVGACSAH